MEQVTELIRYESKCALVLMQKLFLTLITRAESQIHLVPHVGENN